jgi:Zn-dependent metalloprotease
MMRSSLKRRLVFLIMLSFGLLGCVRGGGEGGLADGRDDLKIKRVEPTGQRAGSEALAKIRALFKDNDLSLQGLALTGVEVDNVGFTHARFRQTLNDLPVFNRDLIFHFDKSGRLTTISGQKSAAVEAPTKPEVNEEKAGRIAWAQMERMRADEVGVGPVLPSLVAELGYWQKQNGDLVLVWKLTPEGERYPQVFVEARTGGVVFSDSGVRSAEN